MCLGWSDEKLSVFQRQRRIRSPQCTMSSEPSCTGRWASSYLHQSEYLSCDLLSNYHLIILHLLLLSLTFMHLCLILYLTTVHLPCSLFFSILCFHFLYFSISVPFLLSASSLYLIPTSNSPPVFSLIVSIWLLSSARVCLVIRQMSWISKNKSTFPWMYFWKCAAGFEWVPA